MAASDLNVPDSGPFGEVNPLVAISYMTRFFVHGGDAMLGVFGSARPDSANGNVKKDTEYKFHFIDNPFQSALARYRNLVSSNATSVLHGM